MNVIVKCMVWLAMLPLIPLALTLGASEAPKTIEIYDLGSGDFLKAGKELILHYCGESNESAEMIEGLQAQAVNDRDHPLFLPVKVQADRLMEMALMEKIKMAKGKIEAMHLPLPNLGSYDVTAETIPEQKLRFCVLIFQERLLNQFISEKSKLQGID